MKSLGRSWALLGAGVSVAASISAAAFFLAPSREAADLRSAQAALQAAQLNLDYSQERAPIARRVGKVEVAVGNLVAACSQSEPLTRLVSIDPIYAAFSVNEQFIDDALARLAKDGTPYDLARIPVRMGTLPDDDTPRHGELQLIGNEVDADSGTVSERAVFDNQEGRLILGQFVRARIGQPETSHSVVASERAIGTAEDKKLSLRSDPTIRSPISQSRSARPSTASALSTAA